MANLSNADLRRAQVPGPQASWQDIEQFALTFDGYQGIGLEPSRLDRRTVVFRGVEALCKRAGDTVTAAVTARGTDQP